MYVWNVYLWEFNSQHTTLAHSAQGVVASNPAEAGKRLIERLMPGANQTDTRRLLQLKQHLNGNGRCPGGIKVDAVRVATAPWGAACAG